MTSPHPLPAEGGSYIRLADGSLIPADQVDLTDAVAPEPAEATTPQKTGRKAPVKEA